MLLAADSHQSEQCIDWYQGVKQCCVEAVVVFLLHGSGSGPAP